MHNRENSLVVLKTIGKTPGVTIMSYDDFKSPKVFQFKKNCIHLNLKNNLNFFKIAEIVTPKSQIQQKKRKISETKERWELYSLKYVIKIILYPFTVMIRPRQNVRN